MTAARRVLAAVVAAVALASSGCGDDSPPPPIEIDFEVSTDCVVPGDEVTVEAEVGDEDVEVAFPIVYADGKFHGKEARGFTDGDGKFGATFTIPDDAPAGQATMKILAAKKTRSDTKDAPILVASADAPCP